MKKNLEILGTFLKTDFILRYQNSVLGFVWVFLKPFVIFGVLLIVFSIFRQDIPHFPLYLLLGILLFQFFSDGTTFGLHALINKRHLINNIPFEKSLLVFSSVLNAGIHFVFGLIVFGLFLWWYGVMISILGMLIFLFLILCLLALVLGCSFFLSIFMSRWRDTGEVWMLVITILFYLVPIFYPLGMVPEPWHNILWLNPLAQIITFAREVLILGSIPKFFQILSLAGVSFLMFGIGWIFFRKKIPSVCESI